jgi:FixJ family two-component response regulator/AraC-like DNA-binding protein
VLWIDDEVDPADAAVRLLALDGFRIDCAVTGSAGLAMARSSTYDAILLDLRLPDMSGLAVLERMAEEKCRAPILVVTGYADVETAVAAMRLRAVDFRKKPLFGDQLIDAVRAAVCRRTVDDWNSDVATGLIHDLDELIKTGDQDRSRLIRALACALATPDLAVHFLLAYGHALRSVIAEPTSTPTAELIERARTLTVPARRIDTSHSPTVRTAIERLIRNVTNHVRPTEEDLAAELRIDPAHLGRLIRRDTGLGFRDWRRALVMRSAVRMLAGSDEHVDQIAYGVGFNHPSQFDREFLVLFGMSPMSFRRIVRRSRECANS